MNSKLTNRKHPKTRIAPHFNGDRRNLLCVVEALNGEDIRLNENGRDALIRFVEAWNKARRNPWKMKLLCEDRERFSLRKLGSAWEWSLTPVGMPPEAERLENDLVRRGIKVNEPKAGGARWVSSPTGDHFRDLAAVYAGMLFVNPVRDKLSDGPCTRPACRRWFIKKRPLQKQCSRYCLVIVRSGIQNEKKRGEQHEEQLKRARKASRAWRKKSGVDWLEFVSRETGLSKKFLTRAVNRGELAPPRAASTARGFQECASK